MRQVTSASSCAPNELPWQVRTVLGSPITPSSGFLDYTMCFTVNAFSLLIVSPVSSLSWRVNTLAPVTPHPSGVSVSREPGWRYWLCTDHRLSPQRLWVLQQCAYTKFGRYASTNELFLFYLTKTSWLYQNSYHNIIFRLMQCATNTHSLETHVLQIKCLCTIHLKTL